MSPTIFDSRPRRPRSRTGKVSVEDHDLGYEVDDAFILEQRLILEKIRSQNRRQTTEEETSAWSSVGHSSLNNDTSLPAMSRSADEADADAGHWRKDIGSDCEGKCHDHDVANFIPSDWQLIHEHQQRVLERIQRETQLQNDESRSADKKASSDVDLELEYYQVQQQLELDRIAIDRDRSGSAFTSSQTSAALEGGSHVKRGSSDSFHRIPSPMGDAQEGNARGVKLQDTASDSVTTLSNGKKLRLRGTKHTLKAISKGTAILVSCAGCQTLLQVPSSCTAVYCYVCDAVTPMDLARSISDSHSQQSDSEIAIALQQQELDLALSRDRN
jgi:LSD1 subclass zinc finger protein